MDVDSSWFLIGSIPVLWSSLSSLYSVVSFSLHSVWILSSACVVVLFFSFSITISGFTAMYFTGLPSFGLRILVFLGILKRRMFLNVGLLRFLLFHLLSLYLC